MWENDSSRRAAGATPTGAEAEEKKKKKKTVVEALGFPDVHLGISGAFFVALAGSLLTAVPLTPAGLGVVELGVAGLLTVVYGVPATEAGAIILVDRAISVLSVIIFGSVAYVFSPLRRGRGLRNVEPPTSPPASDPAAA